MSVLANANAMGAGGVDTGDIPASLRFRSAASAYISRTFGTPTNNTSWALSVWVRRAALGSVGRPIISDSSGLAGLQFISTDALNLYNNAGSTVATSTALFRDPTGHGHLFVRSNGTNIKGYLNNQEVFSYTGTITNLNSAITHYIGRYGSAYADGYKSRFCWVDNGGSLTPGDFAYQNTEINEWVSKSQSAVKAVVDAGGTNSFMLDFDDATSLTTLGYDKSSKGNNWTLNNFSLTAGTSYDWMLDVPGNSFATLNPLSKGSSVTLQEGNLSYYQATASHISQPISQAVSSGKWYAEVIVTAVGGTYPSIGMATSSYQAATEYVGQSSTSWGYTGDGTKRNSGSTTAYGDSYTTGDVIGIILDVDSGKLYFSKNGTVQNAGDPVAGTGFAYSGLSGSFKFALSGLGTPSPVTLNFCAGQAPLHASATYHSAAGGYFRYAPPTGFKALCQRNMPDGESITTSGSFTGTLNADGPYIDIKGVPTAMTINGNAVTFGTHADKTSSGFKIRTASSSYNNTGSNTFSVTSTGAKRKYSLAQGNP